MDDWTTDEIASLRAAVASGVLTVSYAGPPARTVTYQSLSEMRKLLATMQSQGASGVTHRNAAVSRGFGGPGRCGWRRNG